MNIKKLKKNGVLIKTWDINFAKDFFEKYKNDLQYFSLELLSDYNVFPLVLIENGLIKDTLDGKVFPLTIDGVETTCCDIPCMKVIFKGGKQKKFECFVDGYLYKGKKYFLCSSVLNIEYIKRHHKQSG